MRILGISGKRESGKSSLAKALEAYGYQRVSLAQPLKEMCKHLYGLSEEQLFGKDKESPTRYRRTGGQFFTPRDILIREGCLKRSINPDFWSDKLWEFIQQCSEFEPQDKFVIDDIRFLNEIEYFKKLGAKFIRLERTEEAIGKAALDDLSETELDSYKAWDFLLPAERNINLDDLRRFAGHIVDSLGQTAGANKPA